MQGQNATAYDADQINAYTAYLDRDSREKDQSFVLRSTLVYNYIMTLF